MCGIAGYFGTKNLDEGAVSEALRRMARRGPDHAAARRFRTPTDKNVVLLHSRLSILDLDPRSNQPFSAAGKTIVFNGEVYNYVEVGRELEARGFRPVTTSDTEVLVHALATFGEAALERCEGMWAFACYDDASGALLLSRDRFGEKPLYLHRDASGLYFASEVKLLEALAGKRFAVDTTHLRRFLVNGYKALYKRPSSFHVGVSELAPGHVLALDADGRESTRAYFTPRAHVDAGMSREDAVRLTREKLIRSVELRLRADVRLAFCMSGGIDSNSLISIAKNVLGYDVHGFTIASADARYEESELVSQAVAAQNLRHTVIRTDPRDFLPQLRELVRYHDAPVYTITYYAHWLLQKSIHDHGYRIAVSGTAADELFSGYYDHHLFYLHEVAGDPALFERSLAAWNAHIRPIVRNPLLQDPRRFVESPAFRDHIYLDADEFSEALVEPFHEAFDEHAFEGAGLLHNRMLNELFHEAVPVILHEDDLNAMYYSIENRSPFLDRALFEHAFSIPPKHLVRDGAAKSVLRDAMRGIVPDAILDSRRKVGFNAPVFDFLDPDDPSVRAEILRPSPIFDVVKRDKVEKLLSKEFLPNSQSKFLFNFLCCKMFLEEAGA